MIDQVSKAPPEAITRTRRCVLPSTLLLLTHALQPSTEVLPALGLLPHRVRVLPSDASALIDAPASDAVLIDGRRDLPAVAIPRQHLPRTVLRRRPYRRQRRLGYR